MTFISPWRCLVCCLVLLNGATVTAGTQDDAQADEQIFSGPQPGEALTGFTVRGVFGDDAGKELDFVTSAAGQPIVLIFVHDVNRQSISLTRIVAEYTSRREEDGLATGVVWLADDISAAESELKRVRHALAERAPTGISTDGREGPGRYGLNRKVTLTILVGRDNLVTANFALVQPSLQTDLPKILQAVVDVVGGEVPKLEDLPGMQGLMRDRAMTSRAEELNLRPLLTPVIRRDASPEEVDQAARRVEARADEDEAVRREVGRIANTIINAGRLENYGTPRAQEYLRKWADKYGAPKTDDTSPPDKSPPGERAPADKTGDKTEDSPIDKADDTPAAEASDTANPDPTGQLP